jgi:glycosyltransferase involved in cell wall biosynthesis
MPCHNGTQTIERSIKETINTLGNYNGGSYELIVIGDNSSSGAFKEIEEGSLDNDQLKFVKSGRSRRKCQVFKKGFEHAEGRYICFLDGESDLYPRLIPTFIGHMENQNVDGVVGSKCHSLSVVDCPMTQGLFNGAYRGFVHSISGFSNLNNLNGLKLFRRELLDEVLPSVPVRKHALERDLLIKAHNSGYRIIEAPMEMDFISTINSEEEHEKNKVTVIVPTYNEKEVISSFIKRLHSILKINFNLIIVDDSPDMETVSISKDACQELDIPLKIVKRAHKKGKGSAIKTGLKIAKGEKFVIIDADLEYPPENILPMLEKLEESDIVISVKNRKGVTYRGFFSYMFRFIVLVLFNLPFDTQSGLKVLNRKAKNIEFDTTGWSWDVEFLYKCKQDKLKISPHNITYSPRKKGHSKISPIKAGGHMLLELLKIRVNTY